MRIKAALFGVGCCAGGCVTLTMFTLLLRKLCCVLPVENDDDDGNDDVGAATEPLIPRNDIRARHHLPLTAYCEELDSFAYMISADYINDHLRHNGINWRDCPYLPHPDAACKAMRAMCEHFEKRSPGLVAKWLRLTVTPASAYPVFEKAAKNIFLDEDGAFRIDWDRIVMLFVFGGELAVQCHRDDISFMFPRVSDWVAIFSERHLDAWIVERHGWVSFGTKTHSHVHFATA